MEVGIRPFIDLNGQPSETVVEAHAHLIVFGSNNQNRRHDCEGVDPESVKLVEAVHSASEDYDPAPWMVKVPIIIDSQNYQYLNGDFDNTLNHDGLGENVMAMNYVLQLNRP